MKKKSTGFQQKKLLKLFLVHFCVYCLKNIIDQFEAFIYWASHFGNTLSFFQYAKCKWINVCIQMLSIIFLFVYIQISFVDIVLFKCKNALTCLFSFPHKKIESNWLAKAKENLMRVVLFFRFFLSLSNRCPQTAARCHCLWPRKGENETLCATLLHFCCSQSPSLVGWVSSLEPEEEVMTVLAWRGNEQIVRF